MLNTENFDIIEERCTFFKDRVNSYALNKGLTSKEVVEHLQEITRLHGEHAITGIIDDVVPGYLHSSRAPQLREVGV